MRRRCPGAVVREVEGASGFVEEKLLGHVQELDGVFNLGEGGGGGGGGDDGDGDGRWW